MSAGDARRAGRRIGLRAMIAIAMLAWAGPAAAQANGFGDEESTDPAVQIALGHFRSALELFDDRSYEAALVEFQRAYELSPNYRVLYNIAVTRLELQQYAGAYRAFEGYLAGGGNEIPPDRRTAVQTQLDRLRNRVAWLRVVTDVEGGQIVIDDEEIEPGQRGQRVLVDLGRHQVSLLRPDRPPIVQRIAVAAGDDIVVDLSAPPTSGEGAIVPTSSPTVAPPRGRDFGPFAASASITGVLLIAAGVMGGLALDANSELDAQLAAVPANREDVAAARGRVWGYSIAADTLAGTGILAAGFAAYFLIAELMREETSVVEPTAGGVRISF